MPSKTDICNMALAACGKGEIASVDDGAPEANACKTWYARTLAVTLASHPFADALKRASLARLADAPAFGWQNAFMLPVDCLSVMRLNDGQDGHDIEGGRLLTNAAEAKVIYVSNEPERIGEPLAAAVAARLAAEIARLMGLSHGQRGELLQEANLKLALAIDHDTAQEHIEAQAQCTWLSQDRFAL